MRLQGKYFKSLFENPLWMPNKRCEEITSILPSLSLLKIIYISFWYQFILTAFPSIVIK